MQGKILKNISLGEKIPVTGPSDYQPFTNGQGRNNLPVCQPDLRIIQMGKVFEARLTKKCCSSRYLSLTALKSTMYYVLFYKTVDNYIEKRAPFREEHLKLANAARANGTLVMAGALADSADEALLVFKADSPQVAEDFAKNDPYVKNGLITEWRVRAWTVVVSAS